jgi:hypothetical protein
MYIRGLVLPLLCLSFFPPHATSCILTQYNYVLFLSLLPGSCFLCPPSRPSCPRPHLAQSPHLCSHCAKSALATPPSQSQKVASPAAPYPPPRRCSVHARSRSRVPVPARREFLGFRSHSSPAVTMVGVDNLFEFPLFFIVDDDWWWWWLDMSWDRLAVWFG